MIPAAWAAVIFMAATTVMPTLVLHLLGIGVTKRMSGVSAVFLTFDDGPDPVFTPAILDVLKWRDAKATFFCLGEKVSRYPEIVRRISNEGHEIGLHGFDHRHPWADPPWRVMRGISASISAIEAVSGRKPLAFRPAWGFWSLWNLLATRNAHRVLWSLPGKDWVRNATPRSVAEGVARLLRPGDVLLLHDGGTYSGITAECLPELLDVIERRGLKTATISEMATLRAGGSSLAG